ncbi:MAG: FadR/GntR family transcriptional regulator [Beutenbergiaceae bacterium]
MHSESRVAAAVEGLIALIEQRQLRAGDALPSTAELAELLQVSRTIAREAIAELAGQGLLQRHQGRETVVSTPAAEQISRLMRLRFLVGSGDVRALHEYSVLVAVAAATLAAERSTPTGVEVLTSRLGALRESSPDQLRQAEHEFFLQLGIIANNDVMLLSFQALGPLIAELQPLRANGVGQAAHHRWLVQVCGTLLARIAAHDTTGAAAAMREYLGEVPDALMQVATARPAT